MNTVAKKMLSTYSNVIFFPLDTDEFLSQEIIDKIRKSSQGYGYLDWRMCWPNDVFISGESNEVSIFEKSFITTSFDYLGNKHFLRSTLLEDGYLWGQAAHDVFNRMGFIKKGLKLGNMTHMPVRSFEQIYSKFSRGSEAHSDRALNAKDGEGENIFTKHWKVLPELLSDHESVVKDAILRYLPPGTDISKGTIKSWVELIENV